MSAAWANAPGLFAQVAPRSSRSAALSGVRFQTTARNPASRMFAAMGCPIRPRPAMPTVGGVSMRITVSRVALTSSDAPAIEEPVDDDRSDQDGADGNGLEIRLHADEIHAIGENGDEERAKDRPDDPTFATAE